MPDNEDRLEDFAVLFAKVLDLIARAVAEKKTIPHAFFRLRDHFVVEI